MVYRRIEELDEQDTSGMYSYTADNEDVAAAGSRSKQRILSASMKEETIESSKYRRIQIIEVKSVDNGKETLERKIIEIRDVANGDIQINFVPISESWIEPMATPPNGILRKPTKRFPDSPRTSSPVPENE